jgi:ADP-heptose:LPS heptosyltransferase
MSAAAPTRDTGGALSVAIRLVRSSSRPAPPRRILVIKLDHLGDLLIALPALTLLRGSFPGDQISLVCGSWNKTFCERLDLFNEILTHDFFPRNARGWDGRPNQSDEHFKSLLRGAYDIAIDLRVEEEARHLLDLVDARLKFRIGKSSNRSPADVSLQFQESVPEAPGAERNAQRISFRPQQFLSRNPRGGLFLETDFSYPNAHVWWGPYVSLPVGQYAARFHFVTDGLRWRGLRAEMVFDVAQDAQQLASTCLRGRDGRDRLLAGEVVVPFHNPSAQGRVEFRLWIGPRPFAGKLRFLGVSVDRLDIENDTNLRDSNRLHRGEMLSLLVQLVVERSGKTAGLPPLITIPGPKTEDSTLEAVKRQRGIICIAPLTNSEIRDWPFPYYIELVQSILSDFQRPVALLGAAEHASALEEITRACANDPRVFNLAGRTAWDELPALFRHASLVVSNNSGIAHLAASCGAAVVAIYSGSHLPEEWGPRGPGTILAMVTNVACSPCGFERTADCPHEHRCMRWITPRSVLGEIARLLEEDGSARVHRPIR